MINLSHAYTTDVLTQNQLEFLASKLPQPASWTGKKPYQNLELLPGILKVLRSGCRWRDLNLPGYPDGSTHWRRMRFWKKAYHFRHIWELLLRLLQDQKKLKLGLLSIDGSLMQSFAFSDTTGFSGKHSRTGTKISTISDQLGVPLGMIVSKGNFHDMSLAPATLDAIRIAKGAIQGSMLLADKGYDGKNFRKYTADSGLFPNIPKRKNVRVKEKWLWYYLYNKTEGKKRYVIERTNAWLKSFRRLRMRFDYTLTSFEAFLYLAILVICVRKLMN